MNTCKISILLANLCSVYIISSIIYLIVSQSFGTPFKNALKKYPELIKIKQDSVLKRKNLFYFGMIISILLLFIFNPFGKCY